MEVGLYLEVRQLFQTKWDPLVLDVLAEGPSRFLALARRLRRCVDDQLVDGHVTRSLTRLQELGLVQADPIAQGSRQFAVYSLTDEGRHALDTYRAILATYAQAQATPRVTRGAHTAARSASARARGTNESRPHAREGR